MEFPAELKYTKDHEWVRIEDGIATIGITAFAQDQLGDIVYVEIETEGEDLDAGEVFGSVEAVKTVSDLYMPVKGTVQEINPALEGQPELVNQDPYGDGWMIKVAIAADDELGHLLSSEMYETEIAKA